MINPVKKIKEVTEVSVGTFYEQEKEELKLEIISGEKYFDRTIKEPAVNRPGLALSGFYLYFAYLRLQVLGNSETSYIEHLGKEEAAIKFAELCNKDIPGIIVTKDNKLSDELIALADNDFAKVPIIYSDIRTPEFLNLASLRLEHLFAPSMSIHGCMVEYQGTGILIMGASGTGKSETAIGLLERGGALISDDIVNVSKINGELIAKSNELTKGILEMRGIGIINVANIFGLSSLRNEAKLDLIVNLKPQQDLNNVDRLGIRRETFDMLGIDVPLMEIPVAPGRDTTRIVAVAALEHQLRDVGYDMAEEFNQRILKKMHGGAG